MNLKANTYSVHIHEKQRVIYEKKLKKIYKLKTKNFAIEETNNFNTTRAWENDDIVFKKNKDIQSKEGCIRNQERLSIYNVVWFARQSYHYDTGEFLAFKLKSEIKGKYC